MSTKFKDLLKSTTKLNDTEILILEKVGLNYEPLSSHDIKKEVKIVSGDIHRYIRKLCPLLRERGQLIFNLNGFKNRINDHRYKLKLIKKINYIYDLNLNIPDEHSNYPLSNNKEIEEGLIEKKIEKRNEPTKHVLMFL